MRQGYLIPGQNSELLKGGHLRKNLLASLDAEGNSLVIVKVILLVATKLPKYR